MKKEKVWDLLLFIISAELAGAVSSLAAGGNFRSYYDSLIKPPLAPPGWLFPVVWGILYALMGLSAYLIDNSGNAAKRGALDLYWVQLAANVLWSPVFFGMKSFGGGAAVVIVMLVLIVCMIAVFWHIDRRAALIVLPYLAWTVFAAYLTFGFYFLNT